MLAIIFFVLLFGTLSLINKILGDLFKYSFIGRCCLIFFLLGSGFTHFNSAMSMTSETAGVTEMKRNIIYFTGIVELILAAGLVFLKTAKWAAGIFIFLMIVYASLRIAGVSLEAEIGIPPLNKNVFSILSEYFVLIIWTAVFGIYFATGDELIGWKGKAW